MFEDKTGRLATNLDEAEAYLWRFMRENRLATEPRIMEHTHDFDLYLPWMLQIFERHGPQPGEELEIDAMQSLYMEAAWSLVVKGDLRPGPRLIGGDQPKDGYGNGYSLTAAGREKLRG